VAVNCAAIPHNLLESEMFGYEKGAFTGAMKSKPGKFELADGGTLLLDEVGEMDIQLQAKLLRVIQESEVDRLGGKSPVPVDVRIIATTNVDLLKAIDEKSFRGDLYYRLNVIPVKIPPLRDRIEDIALLSEYFIKKYSRINEKPPLKLSDKAMAALTSYPWPGNVRELENAIERAVLICDQNEIIPRHLFLESSQPAKHIDPEIVERRAEAGTTLHDMEKSLIYETLSRVHGNKTQASKILGISVRTMRNKLNEYGDSEISDAQD
jgi:two-component system response regulator FlrC